MSLSIALIIGSVLGVLDSSTGWDFARELLPTALLLYVDNWTRDNLVAGELLGRVCKSCFEPPAQLPAALASLRARTCGLARSLPLPPPSDVPQTGWRDRRGCASTNWVAS